MTDSDKVNPYAAPQEFGLVTPPTPSHHLEVRGEKLAIRVGTVLPARCIKTNEAVIPGENGKRKKIKLSWINPWWALLIVVPFGIFLLILIYLIKTARGTIYVHLSNNTIRKKRIRLSVLFLLGFGLLGLTALAGASPELLLLTLSGGLLFLMSGLLSLRDLTPTHYKRDWFLVKGFHQDFLRELDSGEAAAPSVTRP